MLKRNLTTNNLIKYKVTGDGLVNENMALIQMIKITPINIYAMRDDNKEKYLQNLFNILNSDVFTNLQVIISSESINVKAFIDQLREIKKSLNYTDEQDIKKIKILDDEIENLAVLSLENDVVNNVYYMIYSCENIAKLQEQNDVVSRTLNSTLLTYHFCTLEEQTAIVYKYMNPKRSTYEKFPKSFGKQFDINDFMKIENLEVVTDGLFQYIKSDDLYQVFLYVAKYPNEPWLGFMNKLSSFTDSDVSINLNIRSSNKVIKEYDDTSKTLQEDMNRDDVKNSEYIHLNNEFELLQKKLEEVVAEDIKSCTVFSTIRLCADSIEDLNFKITQAKEIAGRNLFLLRNGFYEQLNLFRSNSPLACNSYFEDTYATDITTKTVAYGFPFIQEQLIDEYQPVYLGKTLTNGLVLFSSDETNSEKLNRNEFIIGYTGSGKTVLILNLLHHRFARFQKQFIIDVEGNQLKNWAIDNGGAIIDCSNGTKGIINPLQIRYEYQSKNSEDAEKQDTDLENIYPLAHHLLFIRDFWRTLYPNEFVETKIKYIEFLLRSLYEKFGYDFKTTAVEIKKRKANEFPIFSDLYDHARQCYDDPTFVFIPKEELRKILLDLDSMANGTESSMFNGYSNVDIAGNDIVLFDVSSFNTGTSPLLQAHLFNILSFIWSYLLSNTSDKVVRIWIDELSTILKRKNESLIGMLDTLMKRIRKFKGGVTTATQQLDDVLKIKDANSIITQSQYKFILSIDDIGAKFLMEMGKYKEEDIEFVQIKASRGQFLLDTGKTKYQIDHLLNLNVIDYFDSLKNK